MRILLALIATASSFAYEKGLDATRLMNSVPERVIRLENAAKGRAPASVDNAEERRARENKRLDEILKVGTYAIVRNSYEDWNDQVVKITSRYEDGSRQLQLDDGTLARVKFNNLVTLSPETDQCCASNGVGGGVEICKGDTVWHPLPTTSLGMPRGKVLRLFENCATVVRDGLDYIYEVSQVGKAVDCAPQKANVCVGKTVYVEGYRGGKRYEFEGPVTQVYTNGTAVMETGLWALPFDAASAVVQTDTLHQKSDRAPASAAINRHDDRALPVPTYPELEPYDAHDAKKAWDRRGIVIPTR